MRWASLELVSWMSALCKPLTRAFLSTVATPQICWCLRQLLLARCATSSLSSEENPWQGKIWHHEHSVVVTQRSLTLTDVFVYVSKQVSVCFVRPGLLAVATQLLEAKDPAFETCFRTHSNTSSSKRGVPSLTSDVHTSLQSKV